VHKAALAFLHEVGKATLNPTISKVIDDNRAAIGAPKGTALEQLNQQFLLSAQQRGGTGGTHRWERPRRRSGAPRPRRRRWPTPPLALQALAVCIAGKILGALGCFLLSQRAKPLVERLMRRHRRLRALERTVHAHPLKATLLVRFSLLPAPIKNYGWGSLGVDFRVFLVATVLEVRPP